MADILNDLEATANAMTAKFSSAELRETNMPRVLANDGCCHITSIKWDVFAPALGEVWTDLSEKCVVFDRHVLNTLEIAHVSGRGVRTKLRRTNGNRAIWSATLLPCGDEPIFPCPECGRDVPRREDGSYACAACHYVVFSGLSSGK